MPTIRSKTNGKGLIRINRTMARGLAQSARILGAKDSRWDSNARSQSLDDVSGPIVKDSNGRYTLKPASAVRATDSDSDTLKRLIAALVDAGILER